MKRLAFKFFNSLVIQKKNLKKIPFQNVSESMFSEDKHVDQSADEQQQQEDGEHEQQRPAATLWNYLI